MARFDQAFIELDRKMGEINQRVAAAIRAARKSGDRGQGVRYGWDGLIAMWEAHLDFMKGLDVLDITDPRLYRVLSFTVQRLQSLLDSLGEMGKPPPA